MELSTHSAITNPIFSYTSLSGNKQLRSKHSFLLRKPLSSRINRSIEHSRFNRFAISRPKSSASDDLNGTGPYNTEKRDSVVTLEVEEAPLDEKNIFNELSTSKEEPVEAGKEQTLEFLDGLKLESSDAYSIGLYSTGALAGLWLVSAIVGAIDSIPLFPKLMEVVGLGYTFWFTTRFLIFKESRDELATKIEEVKKQVLGSSEE